jgi:hypothetical protein
VAKPEARVIFGRLDDPEVETSWTPDSGSIDPATLEISAGGGTAVVRTRDGTIQVLRLALPLPGSR